MTDQGRNSNRVLTALLSVTILAAPFIAWLYGIVPALAVMAIGLAAATYLLWIATAAVPPPPRRWLLAAMVANAVLASACLLAAFMLWSTGRP